MATTLPIFSAADAGTYTPSPADNWVTYLTIPGSSLLIGRSYLLVFSCELRTGHTDYATYVTMNYSGTVIPSLDGSGFSMRRDETVRWFSTSGMAKFVGTGAGVIQLAAQNQGNPFGQIRNMRLMAIDLSCNNTDFPQNSRNGWLYAEDQGVVSLTGSFVSYLSINFTPSGDSDYLILSTAYIYGLGPGMGYARIYCSSPSMPGIPLSYLDRSQGGGGPIMAGILQSPAATPITVHLECAGTSHLLNRRRMLILRMKTFTKQGSAWTNIPSVLGVTPTEVVNAAPLPAPSAGEQFLVFRRITGGGNWGTDGDFITERLLEKPANTVVDTSSTACLKNQAAEYHGPSIFTLDTAAGASSSYTMEVTRGLSSSYPNNFYHAIVAVLKPKVGYVSEVFQDVASSSSILIGGSASLEVAVDVSLDSSIVFTGNAFGESFRLGSGNALTDVSSAYGPLIL